MYISDIIPVQLSTEWLWKNLVVNLNMPYVFLVANTIMGYMFLIKLYRHVIADFFRTSRKNKAVAGILSKSLFRTDRVLKKRDSRIKKLIYWFEIETLAMFYGDG